MHRGGVGVTARKLPPVDAPVTPAEIVRLVERLGHDPERVTRLSITPSATGMTARVHYAEAITKVRGSRDG